MNMIKDNVLFKSILLGMSLDKMGLVFMKSPHFIIFFVSLLTVLML